MKNKLFWICVCFMPIFMIQENSIKYYQKIGRLTDGSMPSPRPVFFARPRAWLLKKGPSPTFWKGPKNLSILFSKFKGPSKAWAPNFWKGLSSDPAQARPRPMFLGPDPSQGRLINQKSPNEFVLKVVIGLLNETR